MTDAIRFPDFPNNHILEDYEVAAYHNQAWFSTNFQQKTAVSIYCRLIRKKQFTYRRFALREYPGFFMPFHQQI